MCADIPRLSLLLYDGKICPYEESGCKFKHKHIGADHEEAQITVDVEENLVEEFTKLYKMESFEAKELLCDNYCRASCGYHRCSDITKKAEQCDERFVEFNKYTHRLGCPLKPKMLSWNLIICQELF